MSGSSGVVAPPQPGPTPAQRVPSPYSLPLHTLRLAGKCALPLVLWFSAGETARWALLYIATEISHGDFRQARLVVTVILMTVIVMLAMTVITGMMLSLRAAMWESAARRADGAEDESFWSSMNRIAPAFAVIYLAWELYKPDAAAFLAMDSLHNLDDNFYNVIFNNIANGTKEETTLNTGLVGLDWRVSLAAMAVALGLRMLFERQVERGSGKLAGIAAAFAEFAFMFCGLNAVFTFSALRADWAEHRVVVSEAGDIVVKAKESVPGLEAFWGWMGEIWPFIVDALVMPLTWLAVAVLVFGGTVDDTRRALRGTRLAGSVDRLEGSHEVTQRSVNRVVGGFQERWVPVVNAFRVTVKGGATLFGLMCLLFVGIRVGADYLDRAVSTFIGSPTPYMWLWVSWPVDFVKNLLVTVLTYCLLAATFDIAATRARARGEDITA
ncbi:hypothetical protein ACFWY5_03480 [Nonomuraea sp. NPDC059007]|uniref:hypothetical protein n=1 Tax=Nonomuraea sp. NPDC059007 TaxID=3346692 RepID=UPI0036C70758